MKPIIKSIWVTPWENETGAPEKRIIHGRYLKLSSMPEKIRVGVKLGQGYFKCGSETHVDWITDFAVYKWENENWIKILHATGLEKPKNADDTKWFELTEASQAYFLEIRRSGIDGWWPCYNIAYTGFDIEVDDVCKVLQPIVRNLHTVKCNPDEVALLQENIYINRTSSTIRYNSPYYCIGFRLKSAGLDFFGLDGSGSSKTYENMLSIGSLLFAVDNDFFTQGPIINPIYEPSVCGFSNYNIDGETLVQGNSLTYRMRNNQIGLTTELSFTMKKDKVDITIKRSVEKTIKLLDSSVFRIAFNSKKAPLTALGCIVKEGETGSLTLPLLLNLPGFAGISVKGTESVRGRFDSIRANMINTFDFELGERKCEDGCYLLEAGEYSGSVTMTVAFDHHIKLKEDTPDNIKQAFGRYVYTCLPYRADTATFSNNGNSMGAPICMDLWGELCEQIGKGLSGVDSYEFLKNTIEIHLSGAPAYASGIHYTGDYSYEEEYLMTGTAVLLGIAKYLNEGGTKEWFEKFIQPLLQKILIIKALDVDDDGLVESIRRKGISGDHQWSTCWYDVISYGYKDAFSNALLYPALSILSRKLEEYGEVGLSQDLYAWAKKIKEVYATTFMTENGWLAGWKCADGKLHDYGFLAVNGAAVSYGLLEEDQAKGIMEKLWESLINSGFDGFDMGLPGNIFFIDAKDMAAVQLYLPFGGYQNGGVTLSQSRHFINGLYAVGMIKEADFILSEICNGLLYGNVIGGVGSGVDWKTWDGVASGYEGLLTDQLGIFQPLIKRYGA